MRKIKKIPVVTDLEVSGLLPKRVKYISPGIAIRNRTWTGFGAGAGLLGYDESDDIKDADKFPNIEDPDLVGSLLEDDSEGVENEKEGAE